MKYLSPHFLFLIFLSTFIFLQCRNKINRIETASPDGNVKVNFFISEEGTAGYLIHYLDKKVIDTSLFDFDFQDELPFKENLEIINSYTSSFDETWESIRIN